MPADGLYLLDCRRGSDAKRAIMFFKNMQPGHNDFQTPDDIVDLGETRHDGLLGVWETGTTQCTQHGFFFHSSIAYVAVILRLTVINLQRPLSAAE